MTHPPSTRKGAKSVARSHTRPSRPRKHEKTCKKEAVGGGDCHQPAVGTIKTCPHVSHVPVPAHQPAHTPQPSPRSSSRGASTHACVTIEFGVCRTVPSARVGSAESTAQGRSFTAVHVAGGGDCGCGVLLAWLAASLAAPRARSAAGEPKKPPQPGNRDQPPSGMIAQALRASVRRRAVTGGTQARLSSYM